MNMCAFCPRCHYNNSTKNDARITNRRKRRHRAHTAHTHMDSYTDLSYAKAFAQKKDGKNKNKIRMWVRASQSLGFNVLPSSFASSSFTWMLLLSHTARARQMLTFIETICPQDRIFIIFYFRFIHGVAHRSLFVGTYKVHILPLKPESHICRMLFYGSKKQCRQSSPVYSHTVWCIFDECIHRMEDTRYFCVIYVSDSRSKRNSHHILASGADGRRQYSQKMMIYMTATSFWRTLNSSQIRQKPQPFSCANSFISIRARELFLRLRADWSSLL